MKFISRLKRLEDIKAMEKDMKLAELKKVDDIIKRLLDEREELLSELKKLSVERETVLSKDMLDRSFSGLTYILERDKRILNDLKSLYDLRGKIVEEILSIEKDKKMYEKLRIKKELDRRVFLFKKEMKLIDEVAIARWKNE